MVSKAQNWFIYFLLVFFFVLWSLQTILPIQDINTPLIKTDNVQEFADGDNTDFEMVFVLTDFSSPDYFYLYKHENRIVGPPVVLRCAAKEEVTILSTPGLFYAGFG